MSSYDDPSAVGEEVNQNENTQKHALPLGQVTYESTREGDVVVVQKSFASADNDGRSPSTEEKASSEGEGRSSPTKDTINPVRRGHTRNLSEHFYDATSLSGDPAVGSAPEQSVGYGYRGPPPTTSPAVGQKHRRVFSGDVTNPPEAHRRINSIGNSSSIKRRAHLQERQHQRVDSAGLDILTAAADVSREELAAAAGDRVLGQGHPWEAPVVGAETRRSSNDVPVYDQSSIRPPSTTVGAHHRPYVPGSTPPAYFSTPHGYSQATYQPPSYYGHPAPGYQRTLPPAQSSYPVQHARGPDPYSKVPTQAPLQQPSFERNRESTSAPLSTRTPAFGDEVPGTEQGATSTSQWRGGTSHEPQSYGPSSGNETGNGGVQPGATDGRPQSEDHNRKPPTVSSWATPVLGGAQNDAFEQPVKGHHRSTSSSLSLLGFDVGSLDPTDTTFLRNLQASTGTSAPAFEAAEPVPDRKSTQSVPAPTEMEGNGGKLGSDKLAPGGTSKRVRRKCTVEGCPNRVVQGGLCIAHGARRKQCKYPGCSKNVKKAGLCSTHGPARKRCDTEGCMKVAVQGGKCIAHGAKKKLCAVEGCTKQAILAGMCKKHHDQNRKEPNLAPSASDYPAQIQNPKQPEAEKPAKGARKPTHTRGLSIFQEMSADAVGTLLSGEELATVNETAQQTGRRHRSSFSRDFAGLY